MKMEVVTHVSKNGIMEHHEKAKDILIRGAIQRTLQDVLDHEVLDKIDMRGNPSIEHPNESTSLFLSKLEVRVVL